MSEQLSPLDLNRIERAIVKAEAAGGDVVLNAREARAMIDATKDHPSTLHRVDCLEAEISGVRKELQSYINDYGR